MSNRKKVILIFLVVVALLLPGGREAAASAQNQVHTVRAGESMWIISNNYNISLDSLIAANPSVTPDRIFPEQKLTLPSGSNVTATANLASREGRTASSRWNLTAGEIELFARLVHSEAAGEPYQGLVAVAASVLNRMKSSLYPNTLSGVVYQVTGGYYQYSPVLDGRINRPAGRQSYQAVNDALAGSDPSGGALGFYNPRKTSNQWVRQQPVTTTIGNHVFFR